MTRFASTVAFTPFAMSSHSASTGVKPKSFSRKATAPDIYYIPLSIKPEPTHSASRGSRLRLSVTVIATALIISAILAAAFSRPHHHVRLPQSQLDPFYSSVISPESVCTGIDGRAILHSGYIGLKGDSEINPKRSFFWYFEAENNAETAPVILTMGGGPGTSGLMNPMFGQSPCTITANGTVPNPDRWTERFNLIALDHPVGAGYSYGTHVNNSRSAAIDVYDFLQKFFRLYPQLTKNQFVISGGSYGGIYVPNIATVIHEQNRAIVSGRGQPGAVHINLESLMISNPISDPISHFRWFLHYRCAIADVYNSTACQELYSILPFCLESIELAIEHPSIEHRVAATNLCSEKLYSADTNDTVIEDVRRKCHATEDPHSCHPEFAWITDFFEDLATKNALGVPRHVNFTAINRVVNKEFHEAGDVMQRHHLLHEPLLEDGIRVLHYVGSQDANCAWPGILSYLKLLRTQFQERFINSEDIPWPSKENATATVRVVGEGAGNMTYILLAEAGHFVVKDQPALTKLIVEHWIENRAFVGHEATLT